MRIRHAGRKGSNSTRRVTRTGAADVITIGSTFHAPQRYALCRALRSFRAAQRMAPTSAQAHFNLGMTLSELVGNHADVSTRVRAMG